MKLSLGTTSMTEFYDLYDDRPETYSCFESSALTLSELGRIRLNFKHSSQNYHHVYVGRVLFDSRDTSSVKSRNKCSPAFIDSWSINFTSQIAHRKAYLTRLIDAFLDGKMKRGSVVNQLIFIDYADNNFDHKKLFIDKDLMKQAYCDYSLLLWNRVSQSNLSKSLKRATARGYQEGATQTILLAFNNIDEDTVKSWSLRIQYRRGESGFKVLESTRCATISRDAHRYLFNKISEYLLGDDHAKPFVLKPELKLGITGQIYLSPANWNLHGLNKTPPSYFEKSGGLGRKRLYELLYDRNGDLISVDKLMGALDAEIEKNGPFNDKEVRSRIHKYYRAAVATGQQDESIIETNFGRDLFNIASIHFSHLILADSGANLAVLCSAPLVEPTNLEREGKFRILSFKRKGDKQFSLRLSPLAKKYWSRYLALCQKFGISGSPLTGPQYFKKAQAHIYTISNKNLTNPTKFWNSGNLWVNAKDWRDYSVNLSLTVTKDVRYSANQHQHTVETSRKHYIAVENQVAVKELSDFFSGLASVVNLYKGKPVAVKIISNDKGGQGLTGTCTSQGSTKDEGFSDEAPNPRCSAMLSCFFCKSYALRATEEDVLMLLSIKEWLPLHSRASSLNMDEHLLKFQPIIERLDDIIADFSDKNEQYTKIVQQAKRQIEIGNLHSYWEMKIAALNEISNSREEQ